MIIGGNLGKQDLTKRNFFLSIFSLCRLGWPRTPNVDQAGLRRTEIFPFACLQSAGLKARAITPSQESL